MTSAPVVFSHSPWTCPQARDIWFSGAWEVVSTCCSSTHAIGVPRSPVTYVCQEPGGSRQQLLRRFHTHHGRPHQACDVCLSMACQHLLRFHSRHGRSYPRTVTSGCQESVRVVSTCCIFIHTLDAPPAS